MEHLTKVDQRSLLRPDDHGHKSCQDEIFAVLPASPEFQVASSLTEGSFLMQMKVDHLLASSSTFTVRFPAEFYANSRLQQISLFRSVYCLLITGHYPITVHFLSQDGAFGTVHWDFKPRLRLTRIFPSTNTCHSDSFKSRGIAIAQKTSTLRWNGA